MPPSQHHSSRYSKVKLVSGFSGNYPYLFAEDTRAHLTENQVGNATSGSTIVSEAGNLVQYTSSAASAYKKTDYCSRSVVAMDKLWRCVG